MCVAGGFQGLVAPGGPRFVWERLPGSATSRNGGGWAVYTRLQSPYKYNTNTKQIQQKYKTNTIEIQNKYNRNT